MLVTIPLVIAKFSKHFIAVKRFYIQKHSSISTLMDLPEKGGRRPRHLPLQWSQAIAPISGSDDAWQTYCHQTCATKGDFFPIKHGL
jgi:hypothetical protein